MYTLLNHTNPISNLTENRSERLTVTYSSSLSTSFDNVSSILLILILSILCLFGVIFMMFGPMMRSEAWKRVDNYIFGREMGSEYREDGVGGAENVDS